MLITHYQSRRIWWTVTTGSWTDDEIKLPPEPFIASGPQRFIRIGTMLPWRHTSLAGWDLVAQPGIIPPRLIDGILTESTIQRVGDDRAEYFIDLILDRDLGRWAGLPGRRN